MMRPPMLPPPQRPVNPLASAGVALALVIGVLIGVPLAALALWFLWSPVASFGQALAALIDAAPNLVAGTFLLAMFVGVCAILWRLFAGAALAHNKAKAARVVKMQHGLPIDVRDVSRISRQMVAPTLQAHYSVEHAKASRPFPELRSYHHTNQVRNDAAQLPEVVDAPAAAPTVPTFGELLDRGQIGPNAPLLLGLDAQNGELITGSWRDLFSTSIGGVQGSGKTWSAVFLLSQSALQAGRLVICDPHANDAESLAARVAPLQRTMLCNIADDERSILAALKMADDKLQKRKKGHAARWPIIVAVDEFLSLRRGPIAAMLPDLIEDFSTEGRKLNCHILLLSQRWDKAAIGDFRNTMSSCYVHRMRRQEAAMMTGLPAAGGLPDDTLSLAPGQCYLLDTKGQIRKVLIPRMSPADVERVGGMLDQVNRPGAAPMGFHFVANPGITPTAQVTNPVTAHAPVVTQRRHSGDITATSANAVTTTAQSHKLSAEHARALALFHEGNDLPAIVKELRGVNPREGRRYMNALAEVTNILREATKGGH